MTNSQPSGPGGVLAIEAEAAATASAIARLRRRISRPGALEHPAVMRELGKLEQQLIAQLDSQAGRRPGRHRSPAREARGSDGSCQTQGFRLGLAFARGSRRTAPAKLPARPATLAWLAARR
jgi:hypothetical protein